MFMKTTLTPAETKALRLAKENGIVSSLGGYNVKRTTIANLRSKGLLSGGVDVHTVGSGRSGNGRSVTYSESWGEITDAGLAAYAAAVA